MYKQSSVCITSKTDTEILRINVGTTHFAVVAYQ